MSEWRTRKTGELDSPRSTNPTGEPIIVPRKDRADRADRVASSPEPEPNLLRFPANASPSPAPAARSRREESAPTEAGAYPPWRDQLKEKVRLAREKRSQEATDEPLESSSSAARNDQNPIVESALRRIRYASYSQTATARAPQPEELPIEEPVVEAPPPVIESRPVAAPAPRKPEPAAQPSNPFVMPRTTKDLNKDVAPAPRTRTLTPRTNGMPPVAEPARTQPPASAERAPLRREEARSAPAPISLPKIRADRQAAAPAPTAETQESFDTEIIEMPMMVTQWPLPEARPATLWVRTMAGACDFEIIATAYLPLFGAYATLNTSLGAEAFFIMLVLLSALVFLYQLATLMVAERTTGMAMLNLRLVNTSDEEMPVTRRQKVLRAWAATIAFLCPPLNLLITRLNHPQRSLPDLVSGTTIVGR